MYYDRFTTATTSKAIQRPHTVLCHSSPEKFSCIGRSGSLIETGKPKGIQHNFNHGLSLMEDGEWAVFMSDDLTGAKVLSAEKFTEADPNAVLDGFIAAVDIAEKVGVKMLGMNSTGNPFYAKNKWSKYGLVDGRCFAIKKTDFRFHEDISTIPDYYATAWHLKKYGGSLIANNFYLDFQRYGSGGLGSQSERTEAKRRDVHLMRRLFPDNVVVRDKPGQEKGTHIVIKR